MGGIRSKSSEELINQGKNFVRELFKSSKITQKSKLSILKTLESQNMEDIFSMPENIREHYNSNNIWQEYIEFMRISKRKPDTKETEGIDMGNNDVNMRKTSNLSFFINLYPHIKLNDLLNNNILGIIKLHGNYINYLAKLKISTEQIKWTKNFVTHFISLIETIEYVISLEGNDNSRIQTIFDNLNIFLLYNPFVNVHAILINKEKLHKILTSPPEKIRLIAEKWGDNDEFLISNLANNFSILDYIDLIDMELLDIILSLEGNKNSFPNLSRILGEKSARSIFCLLFRNDYIKSFNDIYLWDGLLEYADKIDEEILLEVLSTGDSLEIRSCIKKLGRQFKNIICKKSKYEGYETKSTETIISNIKLLKNRLNFKIADFDKEEITDLVLFSDNSTLEFILTHFEIASFEKNKFEDKVLTLGFIIFTNNILKLDIDQNEKIKIAKEYSPENVISNGILRYSNDVMKDYYKIYIDLIEKILDNTIKKDLINFLKEIFPGKDTEFYSYLSIGRIDEIFNNITDKAEEENKKIENSVVLEKLSEILKGKTISKWNGGLDKFFNIQSSNFQIFLGSGNLSEICNKIKQDLSDKDEFSEHLSIDDKRTNIILRSIKEILKADKKGELIKQLIHTGNNSIFIQLSFEEITADYEDISEIVKTTVDIEKELKKDSLNSKELIGYLFKLITLIRSQTDNQYTGILLYYIGIIEENLEKQCDDFNSLIVQRYGNLNLEGLKRKIPDFNVEKFELLIKDPGYLSKQILSVLGMVYINEFTLEYIATVLGFMQIMLDYDKSFKELPANINNEEGLLREIEEIRPDKILFDTLSKLLEKEEFGVAGKCVIKKYNKKELRELFPVNFRGLLKSLPKETDEERNAFEHNEYDRTSGFFLYMIENCPDFILNDNELIIITEYINNFGLLRNPILYTYFKTIKLYQGKQSDELPEEKREHIEKLLSEIPNISSLHERITQIQEKIYSSKDMNMNNLSELEICLMDIIVGKNSHTHGGSSKSLQEMGKDFEELVSSGEIDTSTAGYETISINMAEIEVKIDFAKITDDFEILSDDILKATCPLSLGNIRSELNGILKEIIHTNQLKFDGIEDKESKQAQIIGANIQKIESIILELSKLSENNRDENEILDRVINILIPDPIINTLLSNNDFIKRILRKIIIRKHYIKIPESNIDEVKFNLSKGINIKGISYIINIINNSIKDHVLNIGNGNKENYWMKETFEKIKKNKKLFFDTFRPHIGNITESYLNAEKIKTGNNMKIELIPDRGFIGELSGYIANACYTSIFPLMKEYPNLTPHKIVSINESGEKKLIGSVLIFEEEDIEGNKVLILRALNIPNEIDIDLPVFYEKFVNGLETIAKQKGIKKILTPSEPGIGIISNYPETKRYVSEKYVEGKEEIKLKNEFDFNGYAHHFFVVREIN